MSKTRNITLGKTFSVFQQTTRIPKPKEENCKWESITLPYDLDPGNRVKILSQETELGGEYYIVQDPYLTEIGIVLIRVDDPCSKIKNYCMVAFNMGNSTVRLSYSDKLGYAVYI